MNNVGVDSMSLCSPVLGRRQSSGLVVEQRPENVEVKQTRKHRHKLVISVDRYTLNNIVIRGRSANRPDSCVIKSRSVIADEISIVFPLNWQTSINSAATTEILVLRRPH